MKTESSTQFYYTLIKAAIKPLMILWLFLFSGYAYSQVCTISGNDNVCAAEVSNYSVSVPGSYIYEWTVFGGTAYGTGLSISVSWGNSGGGEVVLVALDPLTNLPVCTGSLLITINENPQPLIVPSILNNCDVPGEKSDTTHPGQERPDFNDCFKVCDSTWITYSTQDNPGSTFEWIITGAANYTPVTTNSIDVFWTGTGSGTVIVIETTADSCVGTHEICVEIEAKPIPAFTTLPTPVSGVTTVCLDQNVYFINNSSQGAGSDIISFEWHFGDGNVNIINVPSGGSAPDSGNTNHSYNLAGTYEVLLIVINECFCRDTFSLTVVVESEPGPDIFCVGNVCPGNIVTYSTNADCPNYVWNVDNGTILSGLGTSSITVEWGSTGPGLISLSTDPCTGYCSATTYMEVPLIPSTTQIYGKENVCLDECYTYSISCDIPIDSIIWQFPPNVSYSFDSINVHEVKICFDNSSFVSGTIIVDYYHQGPGSPQALSCGGQAKLEVTAKPKLFLSITNEICDFEQFYIFNYHMPSVSLGGNVLLSVTDISTSTTYPITTVAPSAAHLISSWPYGPGLFYIHAEGLNGQYCNSPVKSLLKVNPAPPPPDSITGTDIICPGQPYSYQAFSTSSDMQVNWTVTNGTPNNASGNMINVVWNASGPYLLEAVQENLLTGCISAPLTFNVNSILPLTPSVINGPDTVCANSHSIFSTPDPGDDFVWSVIPSNAGSVINGQHTNTITVEWNDYVGSASIALIRTSCGQNVPSSLNLQVVKGTVPDIIMPSTACQGTSVQLEAVAGIDVTSYNWDFGDGNNGSGINPVHTYNEPGNHIVTLTVIYGGDCPDTVSVIENIMIYPSPGVTISTPDPNIFCPVVGNVDMYISAPVSGVSYTWFQSPSSGVGTGNFYQATSIGVYYAVGLNSFGCQDTSNLIIVDTNCVTSGCNPNPNYSVDFDIHRLSCNIDSFQAVVTTGTTNLVWNFDDPFSSPSTATGTSPVHTFTEPGFYRVKLCGEVPASPGPGNCIICKTIVDTIEYVPDFYDSVYCAPGIDSLYMKFINNTKRLSTLPVPSYQWSVSPGIGVFSTDENPELTLAPGTYTVTLLVNGSCEISKTIIVPAFPLADFSVTDSICAGAPLVILNNSTGSILQISWDFGDGAVSLIKDPVKVYNTPGTYTINLNITNAYGCQSSASQDVVVLTNDLTGVISPYNDTTICEGDSLSLTLIPDAGYPAYQYLWSNIKTSATIYAKYTGSYYADITDSKGCFYRTTAVNLITEPVPKPKITGKKHLCLNDFETYNVNYSSVNYDILWILNGDTSLSTYHLYYHFANTTGNYTLTVVVTGPGGCSGVDSIQFSVTNPPNAFIISDPVLCEGQINELIGGSTSSNIFHSYWSNGSLGDTIYVLSAGNYQYTVTDTFGCQASAVRTVHPLPKFCGMKSGCYEACDTISGLVWHAPIGIGYNYQWYHNSSALSGETSQTLEVPLYVSGEYQVEITSPEGCSKLSEPFNIDFIECGKCVFDISAKIECDKIDPANGNQTYQVSLNLNNSLGNSTNYNVYSSGGSISGISPATLSAGTNTINFNFSSPLSAGDSVCFNVNIWKNNQRCDTVICIKLPDCSAPCEKQVSFTKFDCAGWDADGNPQYLVCVDVFWGGSNGSTLTINAANGVIIPNPVIVNNGTQTFCFTYTDLPPHSFSNDFVFSFYDSQKGTVCRDTLQSDYRPCLDKCEFNIFAYCSHCHKVNADTISYNIEVTLNNPFAGNTNVTVLPVAGGSLGAVVPDPLVSPGMQTIEFPFISYPAHDTIVCFKIMLTSENGIKCWKEVCVYMQPCDSTTSLYAINKNETKLIISPNPANEEFRVFYNNPADLKLETSIEIINVLGKQIFTHKTNSNNGVAVFESYHLNPGVYIVNLKTGNDVLKSERLMITR